MRSGEDLKENVHLYDRDIIHEYLEDLEVDIPSELEDESRNSGVYELEVEVSLKEGYQRNYDTALIHNNEVEAIIQGSIKYDGEFLTSIFESFRKSALEVFMAPESGKSRNLNPGKRISD